MCASQDLCLQPVRAGCREQGCLCCWVPIYSRLSVVAVYFLPTVQIRAEDKISSEKPLIKFPVCKWKLNFTKLFKTQLQIIIFSCIHCPYFADCTVVKIWRSPGHVFSTCLHLSLLPCTMDQISVQTIAGVRCKVTILESPFKLLCCNVSKLVWTETRNEECQCLRSKDDKCLILSNATFLHEQWANTRREYTELWVGSITEAAWHRKFILLGGWQGRCIYKKDVKKACLARAEGAAC